MNNNEEIMVIKLTQSVNETSSDEQIREHAQQAWVINPRRLTDVDHVIVLFEGTVVGEYHLDDKIVYNRKTRRSNFMFSPYEGPNQLKGLKIKYGTSNPATIKNYNDLMDLVQA